MSRRSLVLDDETDRFEFVLCLQCPWIDEAKSGMQGRTRALMSQSERVAPLETRLKG